MGFPGVMLNFKVTIRRRTSTGLDGLGNPTYGAPTDGLGWDTVYSLMPVRLAFSSKQIVFAIEGERVTPNGLMYYNPPFKILPEDRVITEDGIEYVVTSVITGYGFGAVVDHYEAILDLP